MERIEELTQKARDKGGSAFGKEVSGSPIYAAWIKYARKRPERVFGAWYRMGNTISATHRQYGFAAEMRDRVIDSSLVARESHKPLAETAD